jgi:hypothetical protein
MVALVACFFFGVVLGAVGYSAVRAYYWRKALNPQALRMRYRRYHTTKYSRILNKRRRYYPSRYRLSRLLDRLAVSFDDSDLRR